MGEFCHREPSAPPQSGFRKSDSDWIRPQFAPLSFNTPMHRCPHSTQLEACWIAVHMQSQPHIFYTSLAWKKIAKWMIGLVVYQLISVRWVTSWLPALSLLLCILSRRFMPTHALTYNKRSSTHTHMATGCNLITVTYARHWSLSRADTEARWVRAQGGESRWTQWRGKEKYITLLHWSHVHIPAHFTDMLHLKLRKLFHRFNKLVS